MRSAARRSPRTSTPSRPSASSRSPSPERSAPFGRSDNVPRAVARRIGADPARAILEPVGGQGPQHLVNELCGRIAGGEIGMALICGAEAISTVRHLTSARRDPRLVRRDRRRAGGPRARRSAADRRPRPPRRRDADQRLRPVRKRPPGPPRPRSRGLQARDGAAVRADDRRRRRQSARHVPGAFRRRDPRGDHPGQPDAERALSPPPRRPRPGQPGRRRPDGLGRRGARARGPGREVRLPPRRRRRARADADGAAGPVPQPGLDPRRPARPRQRRSRGLRHRAV